MADALTVGIFPTHNHDAGKSNRLRGPRRTAPGKTEQRKNEHDRREFSQTLAALSASSSAARAISVGRGKTKSQGRPNRMNGSKCPTSSDTIGVATNLPKSTARFRTTPLWLCAFYIVIIIASAGWAVFA